MIGRKRYRERKDRERIPAGHRAVNFNEKHFYHNQLKRGENFTFAILASTPDFCF